MTAGVPKRRRGTFNIGQSVNLQDKYNNLQTPPLSQLILPYICHKLVPRLCEVNRFSRTAVTRGLPHRRWATSVK